MRSDTTQALIADIGGTNARLGLASADSHGLEAVRRLPCADFPDLTSLLQHYLEQLRQLGLRTPGHAWLAIAGPVENDPVRLTNHDWEFSRPALAATLGIDSLTLINDFIAQARGIPELAPENIAIVLPGRADPDRVCLVIGPGTGLGTAMLVPTASGWLTLPGEGGHVHFAPTTPEEDALLHRLRRRHRRVSVERLLSGNGLLALYRCLAEQQRAEPDLTDPAAITAAVDHDPLARRSVDLFLKILGDVAGDAALTTGARGGVYLCGGILPRLRTRLATSGFGAAFRNKGRMQGFMRDIPVWLVSDTEAGLLGAAAAWRESLKAGPVLRPAVPTTSD